MSRTLFIVVLVSTLLLLARAGHAQAQSTQSEVQQLRQQILDLERRVAALEEANHQLHPSAAFSGSTGPQAAAALSSASAALRESTGAPTAAAPQTTQSATPAPATTAHPASPVQLLPATLPGGVTLNYYLDGYYEYNFNHPVGGVNNLRAYDVTSNSFNLGQADIIFDMEPDVSAGRRYGGRLDLMFGQATATLQGSPANEARPSIYRNIYQAYGTYIVPVGSGLSVNFGKWASSLGIEGNYAKDQMNYTRSYLFYFLPFYHMGFRTSYSLNNRITANYWLVNGTQQTEDQNGFKDELFGLALTPAKNLSWTLNYYLGQDHPDTIPATHCTVPLQPGLCEAPILHPPNGRTDIFDSYATWQVSPRWTLAGEGDYYITREWANPAPGESSAPSHLDGGAAYLQYQLNPHTALAARSEYISDRDGLFSNRSQALKEVTATYKYNFADGLDAFLEYRRDWSNIPYFGTNNPAMPANHQDTATLGLVWWYGGKQGSW